MIKKLFFIILFFCKVSAEADWTILVYMNPGSDLIDMAIKNLSDMALDSAESKINFLVQLNLYDNLAIRYKINKNSITPVEQIKTKSNNFEESVKWAFEKNRAKNTGIILWGHNFGILQPKWDPEKYDWDVEPDLSQKIGLFCMPTKKSKTLARLPKEYLKNCDITNGLKTFHEITKNKLDILGFDTCMGTSLELNYQFAPYVHYHIGSQNNVFKEGWNYKKISSEIARIHDPKKLAILIVESFGELYDSRGPDYSDYTLSAIDLSYTFEIVRNLDLLTKELISENRNYILNMRKNCLGLGMPMYVDALTFFQKLRPAHMVRQAHHERLISLLKKSIIINKTGTKMAHKATGHSIYFPLSHIDTSYLNSSFAKETNWIKFLEFLFSNILPSSAGT